MKPVVFINFIFVVISAFVASAISTSLQSGTPLFGAGLGLLAGGALVALSLSLKKKAAKRLGWGALGFAIGVLTAGLINAMTSPFILFNPAATLIWTGIVFLFFPYMGMTIALKWQESLHEPAEEKQNVASSESLKILDTSVIIDGRISDLCETGFLEGVFLTPQFILHELQHIADSSDSMKRARGRRGLDVLHKLQEMPGFEVRIVDTDYPEIREVDSKIVALAKDVSAKVITNDLNLNKVAELQGVQVLNINQLCNALKPVVLPGEVMRVFVLKEGKEFAQGIAYLDDGTMIVIDEARKSIGKNVAITVTSVLQTPAGRMIFSRIKEEPTREAVRAVRGT